MKLKVFAQNMNWWSDAQLIKIHPSTTRRIQSYKDKFKHITAKRQGKYIYCQTKYWGRFNQVSNISTWWIVLCSWKSVWKCLSRVETLRVALRAARNSPVHSNGVINYAIMVCLFWTVLRDDRLKTFPDTIGKNALYSLFA